MIRRLADEICRPCREGEAVLSREETAELLSGLSSWRLDAVDGVPRLVKVYPFRAFADGMAFAKRVAEMADRENHHPALLVEWGRVSVSWWTHSLRGLHRNDFILAARTDRVLDLSQREGF